MKTAPIRGAQLAFLLSMVRAQHMSIRADSPVSHVTELTGCGCWNGVYLRSQPGHRKCRRTDVRRKGLAYMYGGGGRPKAPARESPKLVDRANSFLVTKQLKEHKTFLLLLSFSKQALAFNDKRQCIYCYCDGSSLWLLSTGKTPSPIGRSADRLQRIIITCNTLRSEAMGLMRLLYLVVTGILPGTNNNGSNHDTSEI